MSNNMSNPENMPENMPEQMSATVAADTADRKWRGCFFDEQNIVNTMKCLLLETSRTIEDVSELCFAIIENNTVLCLTHRGLLPIASAHMYIFPYEKMNKQQLQALRSAVKNTKQTFTSVYENDKYAVHGLLLPKVEDYLVLFAANCLISHGLGTCTWKKNGTEYRQLESSQLTYHINATLLQIVHKCELRNTSVCQANMLLLKHGVRVHQKNK